MRAPIVWLLMPIIHGAKRSSHEDDEAFNPAVDLLDQPEVPRPVRVRFGHIFEEGVEDPYSPFKQPIDPLELSLKTPMTSEEEQKYLKEVPPERILKVDNNRYRMYREDIEDRAVETQSTPKNMVGPTYFDFEAIHAANMARLGRPVLMPKENFEDEKDPGEPLSLPPGALEGAELRKNITFTNCTEFSKKSSSFHPKDVVDINWTPFYVWSPRLYLAAVVHKFTYPTKKLVQEYKTLYSRFINASLDWEQPKLVLNETIEMLLIADPRDRRGLFHGIPRRPLPKDPEAIKRVRFTVPRIRVKIVYPYLAMMHCEEYYATIMAAPGNEPTNDKEKIEEAKILNFTGIGYPVERDWEAEAEAKRELLRHQKRIEQIKQLKALDTDAIRVDMDSLWI